jgi:hypothetical protein
LTPLTSTRPASRSTAETMIRWPCKREAPRTLAHLIEGVPDEITSKGTLEVPGFPTWTNDDKQCRFDGPRLTVPGPDPHSILDVAFDSAKHQWAGTYQRANDTVPIHFERLHGATGAAASPLLGNWRGVRFWKGCLHVAQDELGTVLLWEDRAGQPGEDFGAKLSGGPDARQDDELEFMRPTGGGWGGRRRSSRALLLSRRFSVPSPTLGVE